MERNRSRHHPSDDRCRTQTHQHVAGRVDNNGLIHLKPARKRDRARGLNGTSFKGAEHT
jgi:hypothetical protein